MGETTGSLRKIELTNFCRADSQSAIHAFFDFLVGYFYIVDWQFCPLVKDNTFCLL